MKILIFTDLDGSLLNHDDYSFNEARPVIEKIRRSGIPLILTTSKTRREVELLQNEMEIHAPFVFENGAAIYFPPGYRGLFIEKIGQEQPFYIIQLGISYNLIRSFVDEVRDQFKVSGFGDLSVHEISALTGLPYGRAELAKYREYTEPFIINSDQDIHMLESLAEEWGIKVTKGGRFYHMIGIHQDKGEAVKIVRDLFDRREGEKHLAIGIGDSANDLPMLKHVDIPVLIPHPVRGYLDASLPGLVKAEKHGSIGWNEIMERLLDEFTTNHI